MKIKGNVIKYGDNVDTDVIIPARYLNTANAKELAAHCMEDLDKTFVGRVKKGDIIVGGANFGCGSSREHAPWALLGYGFRAVVSTGFADIFRNNAVANGLLPIALRPAAHAWMLRLALEHPRVQVTVSLERGIVTLPDGATESFPIDGFDRECLLQGVDRLGYLLGVEQEIGAFEAAYATGVSTLPGASLR